MKLHLEEQKMSKKTCFMIFVIAVIALIAAFVFKISAITGPAVSVFGAMKSPYIAASAVILALLLNKQKHYWLIMLACAVLAAIIVQVFIAGGALAFWPILYKAVAFLVYAFLITLIRFMI